MSDRTPLLNGRTIATIQRLVTRGLATVPAVVTPPAVIDLARQNPATGRYEPHLVGVELIALQTLHRDEAGSTGHAGSALTVSTGELYAWAPLDLAQDDRFLWGGHVCQIVTVDAPVFGVIRARYRIVQTRKEGP